MKEIIEENNKKVNSNKNFNNGNLKCEMCLNTHKTAKIINHNGKNICIECYYSIKYPRDPKKMKEEIKEILNNKLNNKRNKAPYNCIMALSGGKDSIVALYLLIKEFNVKPLCITVDNNYLSKRAIETAIISLDT